MMYSTILKISLLLPIVFFNSYSWACSCGASQSFKYNFESDFTDLVLHGKIIGYTIVINRVAEIVTSLKSNQRASSVQVEIIDVLKGDFTEKVISVPSGGGAISCNIALTELPIGSQWIFAMKERQVSYCGENLLKVEGLKVIDSNHIDKWTLEKQEMSLTDLYQMLGIPNPSFKRDGFHIPLN